MQCSALVGSENVGSSVENGNGDKIKTCAALFNKQAQCKVDNTNNLFAVGINLSELNLPKLFKSLEQQHNKSSKSNKLVRC